MKKLLLSFAIIIGFGLTATAQKEGAVNKISIGGEFLYPLKDFGVIYKIGYGASVQGEYNVLPKLNITGSVGYVSMAYSNLYKDFYENVGVAATNIGYYPAKLGVKYYYKKIYGAVELGGSFPVEKEMGSLLSYAGGIGTSFSISPKSSLDVGARYEEWNLNGRYPFVGLRVAYAFGL